MHRCRGSLASKYSKSVHELERLKCQQAEIILQAWREICGMRWLFNDHLERKQDLCNTHSSVN